MRLVRSAGQNVSPSDDGRLYDQIFTDGLFTDTSFAMLGTNNVQVGAMYGDLCGRDFTIEQQTITVTLPEGAGETTGYIYVEIDTSAETPLSIGSALAPFTPTYEDINVNGAVAQMIVAEYTADAVAVVSITPVYKTVSAGGVGSLAEIETSPTKSSHAAGTYLVYDGKLYITLTSIAAGELLTIGTNISATTAGDELSSLKAGLIVTEARTSSAITIEANGRGVFVVDVSKSGYTPIGIAQIALANNYMYIGGYSITGTDATVVIHNGYGRSAGSQTVYLTVLYRKN